MDTYLIGSWLLNGKHKESILRATRVYRYSSTAREIISAIGSDNDHEDDEKRQKADIDPSRKDESLKDFTNAINGRVMLLAYGRALCTRARVFHTHVEQIDRRSELFAGRS